MSASNAATILKSKPKATTRHKLASIADPSFYRRPVTIFLYEASQTGKAFQPRAVNEEKYYKLESVIGKRRNSAWTRRKIENPI